MARYVASAVQVLDKNGDPIVGADIFFFESGTSFLKAIFQDSDLTVPAANPAKTDGSGYIPEIFTTGVYRIRGEKDGVLVYPDRDPVASVVDELTIIGRTEQQPLQSGQTTVVFDDIETNLSNFYICGDDADNGRLCSPQDFTITNNTTIELTDSYPAGTVVLGTQSESSVVDNTISKQRETIVLTSGQQIVTLATNNTVDSDIFICSNDGSRGVLCPSIDYSIDTPTQITLTDSYPAGHRVFAVQNVLF